MNIKMLKATVAGLILSVSGFANAGLITIDGGLDNQGGDCTFACVALYQQVYDNSLFSNTLDITGISFISSGGSFSANNSWELSLSISNFNVNALTNDFNNNIGLQSMIFSTESFNDSYIDGDLITFNGLFNYNPNDGDLLLSIRALGDSPWSHTVYYNRSSDAEFSRTYNFSNTPQSMSVGNNYGNVTLFDTQPVPEPSTLAIFALGIMGLASRRFKKQ